MKTSCNFFSLRKVTEGDMGLLFKWANDPVVRKWSFNKQPITLEEHKCWFSEKYNDPNTIYVDIRRIHSAIWCSSI